MIESSAWRNDLALMGRLSTVNRDIALYVMRLLDVDAGRDDDMSVADEQQLGARLVDLGTAIQQRAVRRVGRDEHPPIEGDVVESDSQP